MLPGSVLDQAGNSVHRKTGFWRGGGRRPLLDLKLCVQCLHCWISCPDACFILSDGKVIGIDYDHCKGCGICSRECPPMVNAIVLIDEGRFR
ncbi:MAG: 4Fe-4S binding protein [Acidobacteria bacterium]|nr:4Fe-4S binding protein [Acidobacteriota bacterium]